MRTLLATAMLLGMPAATWHPGSHPLEAGSALEPFDYSPWARVLKEFVTENGLVDYAKLKAKPTDLESFVAAIAAHSPHANPQEFPTRQSQLAYWINAYNALVVKGVVDNWPVKSVRNIGIMPFGFFSLKKFTAGGRKVTLNDIESTLRKTLAEPRIHFAIVCASHGCPRLSRDAYLPDHIEQQLDDAARRFINDPGKLRIDAAQNRVMLSSIFKWYRGDFENYARAKNFNARNDPILEYIRQYASAENLRALDSLQNPKLDYLDYDWTVNAVQVP